jgi:4-hydroxy-tetrahydrodipicolinate synthase
MLKGSIVAIVTPFKEDLSVNYDILRELLEWHVESGTSGIVILGTTGEAATLSKEEKLEVFKFTVEVINKRIPVIAGTGSNNTLDTVTFSKEAEALGVDMLLLVAPYYNRANTEGYIRHFSMVADNVNIPIILYNVPSRTGGYIPVEAVVELSKHKNIIGIKEASGNLSYTALVMSKVKDFLLFSGNDDVVLPVLSLGGSGVISVAANVIPKEFALMVKAYFDDCSETALDIQLTYLELINTLFLETNPIPVKEFLNQMGKEVGGYRLPLCEPSDKVKEVIQNTVRNYNL